MTDKPRELSIGNLQRLYAIVMSLAITESLRRLLSEYGDSGKLPEFASVVAVFSLLITAIPFFHSANRYLEATYLTGEYQVKSPALMFDFVQLFVEGLIFFILAVVIRSPKVFYTILAILFVFSSVWIIIRYLTATKENRPPIIWSWPIANFIAAICLLILVWSSLAGGGLWLSNTAVHVALGAIALIRTVYDYYTSWDFYLPSSRMINSRPASKKLKKGR